MEKSLALAIVKIYPDLVPDKDFVVMNDNLGQWISEWNATDKPKPTDAELDTAWNEYVANPPEEPLTVLDQIKLIQAALDDLLLGGGL
jgi:hypothetical protein